MMRNFKKLNLLFLISFIVFGCERNNERPLPKQLVAGQDIIVYDTIAVQLNATSLDSINLTGTWKIIKGDTNSSGFSDIHDSKAIFKGVYWQNYILEWSTTNGENTKSDSISLRFVASIPADLKAGDTYLVFDTNYVVLNGSPLKEGLLGKWSVITKDSMDVEFSNKSIANSICKGKHLTSYILRWTVSNGIEEKYSDARFIIGDIFIDSRDNKRYKMVKIGNQKWMAEDLMAEKYSDGETLTRLSDNIPVDNNSNNKSYYVNLGYVNSINESGYYYSWAAVMRNSASNNNSPSNVQGICPNGWHVPSSIEFEELISFIKVDNISSDILGHTLRSGYGWVESMGKGPNYFGFSALAKGTHRICATGSYVGIGEEAQFWSTSDYKYFLISWQWAEMINGPGDGKCVRCIQNN